MAEHIFYLPLGVGPFVNPEEYGRPKQGRRFRRSHARERRTQDYGGLRIETALVRDDNWHQGPIITCAEEVYLLIRRLDTSPDERFLVVLLNGQHRVDGIYEAAHGSSTSVEVSPKNVFRAAIVANSKALIVAHVHPSGDHEPSAEDLALTKRIEAAGTLLGIPLLDHIIIGLTGHGFTSLAERGLL